MTETGVEDPATWLRAQVEARLALAREAGAGAWRTGCTCESDCPGYPACEEVRGDDIHIYSEGGHDSFQAGHIAANDPQDTIARCEAELAILDACVQGIRNGRAFLAEEVRRLVAGGYKHWAGYREEDWRPAPCPPHSPLSGDTMTETEPTREASERMKRDHLAAGLPVVERNHNHTSRAPCGPSCPMPGLGWNGRGLVIDRFESADEGTVTDSSSTDPVETLRWIAD